MIIKFAYSKIKMSERLKKKCEFSPLCFIWPSYPSVGFWLARPVGFIFWLARPVRLVVLFVGQLSWFFFSLF